MIITNRKMSRDSRKLFEFIDGIASKHGVQGMITPAHIYICDTLVCQFYVTAIENVIRNKLNHIGKKTSRHFDITYWESIVRLMLTDKGAMRNHNISQSLNAESFNIINELMITDYSVEDATMMNRIIADNNTNTIRKACDIAKSSNVRNIQYISAVIDRMNAELGLRIMKIDKLGEKIERSSKIDNKVHEHTILDIALAKYEYQKKVEEYELERKMNELLEGK